MFQLTEASYYGFLSANAQIFGALVGLAGLAYVRVAENGERNFHHMMETTVKDFIATMDKVEEFRNSDDIEVNISEMYEFRRILDQYRSDLGENKYSILFERTKAIDSEILIMKGQSKIFRFNCWLSAGIIALSLLGLLFSGPENMGILSTYAIFVFLLSVFGLVQAVLFYLKASGSRTVLLFSTAK